MSPRPRFFGRAKRTRADMTRAAQALLLNARDLDRVTPEVLVRCHGVPSIPDAERMLAEARRARGR